MASLIFAAGVLTYDKVKSSREKRRARKATNVARFEELEKDNAARFEGLHPGEQSTTPRPSTDPFRDSREVGREDRARGYSNSRRSIDESRESGDEAGVSEGGDVGGSLRRRSNEAVNLDGREQHLIEERGPPPEYESLVGVEAERKKGLKGKIFGKRGGADGDGMVR